MGPVFAMRVCAVEHMWQSDDNLQESVFSYHIKLRDQTKSSAWQQVPLSTEPCYQAMGFVLLFVVIVAFKKNKN